MFDSRTDHSRIRGTHRAGHTTRSWSEMGKGDYIDYGTPKQRLLATPTAEREALTEGIIAYLEDGEPAKVAVTARQINKAHGEALEEHYDRLEEEARLWLAEHESDDSFESVYEQDEAYFEGVNTPNMNTFDDCWMPLVTIEQAREHFGHDFLGNGFHIDSHNVVRNTPAWKQMFIRG